jgi:hypothetical protein
METLTNQPKLDGLLGTVTTGKIRRMIYMLLYGIDGVGKTDFASKANNPIYIGTETGTLQKDVARFPRPETLNEVLAQLDTLLAEKHDYHTVVIDSIDWLEPLVWRQACAEVSVTSIEEYMGGFGKGYIRAAEIWRTYLIPRFDAIADRFHMILIGHALVKTFQDPNQASGYDRYQLKMQEKTAGLIREAVDAVLFATFKIDLIRAKQPKQNRALADGTRVMYTEQRPAFDAKNRFNLPFEMPLDFPTLRQAILGFYDSTDKTLTT